MPGTGAQVEARSFRERGSTGDVVRLWLSAGPSRGDGATPDLQAEAVYRDVARRLGESGLGPGDLLGESVFVRDVRDLPALLAARKRVLGAVAPSPSLVGQPPVDGSSLQVVATAVAPASPHAVRDVIDLRAVRSCACTGCSLAGARIVRLDGRSVLRTSSLPGIGANLFDQAIDAFRAGDRLLREAGLGFHDVVRTWVHLRDIDRDYAELNAARRAFFAESGLDLPPASTGVQGLPPGAGHDVSIVIEATSHPGAPPVEPMTTPLLNEAPTYGADFSRGLRVADEQGTILFVSGTASIDEAGRSVHPGDLAAQAGRMLDNLESLLAVQGAHREDLVSVVVYAKRAEDGPALREFCRARGFDGLPIVFVEAPLCRPELLCEAEAVARLSLPAVPA